MLLYKEGRKYFIYLSCTQNYGHPVTVNNTDTHNYHLYFEGNKFMQIINLLKKNNVEEQGLTF